MRVKGKTQPLGVEELPVRKGMDEAEYQALVEMATWLKRSMVPVEPSSAFVRNLGQELVEASRRSRRMSRRLRRGLLIGAATLGSIASVAGVVTLILLRRRAQVQPGTASG